MSRTGFATTHEELYRARRDHPELIEVPEATFLMIDGQGDPNTSGGFALAVQALYTAAYTIKFSLKKATGRNERVPPLEGLWWNADNDFTVGTKDSWSWTLMIRLPEDLPAALLAESLSSAKAKKPELPISDLRVERFSEGTAAQVMHIGPYGEEGPTIAALHAFIADQGHAMRGKHHEIYLGDPRRSAPSKLKTLLRQPTAS